MRTIHTRTYTNVALTALILLILAIMIRPYLPAPAAYAVDMETSAGDSANSKESTRTRIADMNPNADNAAASREIAASNKEIASAIRETAKAQQEIAGALKALGQSFNAK